MCSATLWDDHDVEGGGHGNHATLHVSTSSFNSLNNESSLKLMIALGKEVYLAGAKNTMLGLSMPCFDVRSLFDHIEVTRLVVFRRHLNTPLASDEEK